MPAKPSPMERCSVSSPKRDSASTSCPAASSPSPSTSAFHSTASTSTGITNFPMSSSLELMSTSGASWGTPYTGEDDPRPTDQVAQAVGAAIRTTTTQIGLPLPRVIIEPGRSVVGQAGVALYTVGSVKDIPGVRRYVALDGGMADN